MGFSLDSAIDLAKQQYPVDHRQVNNELIDVCTNLCRLLHADEWHSDDLEFIHAWLKKIDIAKNHYAQYQLNWRLLQSKAPLPHQYYELSALLALRLLSTQAKNNSGYVFKYSNVIYKILERDFNATVLDKTLVEKHLDQLLDTQQAELVATSSFKSDKPLESSVLPITVLFWEGPIARAYLETIKSMGLKVKKIIKLVSSVDLVTKKPVAQWLPQSLRVQYAANKQFKQMFYWSNYYQNKYPAVIKQIQNQVKNSYGFNLKSLQSATQNKDLLSYCEVLESLPITGLKDPALLTQIQQDSSNLFLFTGGGIVPDELLSISGKKLIHVHPGYLPEIRGADCVLWSQLLVERLSASAFYLAPGIDVGDVILPCWLPELNLNVTTALNNQVKYRMVYGFLDPWVRSLVLKQTILSTQRLKQLRAQPQQQSDGMTYHFMHEKMQQRSFEKLGW